MRNSDIKHIAKIGFGACILQILTEPVPYLSTPIMSRSINRATTMNFTFIFSHKCKKDPAMLCCLYSENKNRKNKFAVIPGKRICLTAMLTYCCLDSMEVLFAIINGTTVIVNVITAFIIIGSVNSPVKRIPP
jgi:hypothetical protein